MLLDGLRREHPELSDALGAIVVRTMVDSESAASVVGFEDGSYGILMSSALQQSLIRLANVICYVDAAQSQVNAIRRRRKRDGAASAMSAQTTAMMRYFLIAQRTTGEAPGATARLDHVADRRPGS